MTLEDARAAYAEALEHMNDGSFTSACAAQAAAIDLQNAEHSYVNENLKPC